MMVCPECGEELVGDDLDDSLIGYCPYCDDEVELEELGGC